MPNKILVVPETAITFQPSGGTVALTVTSLANNAGRVSAQHDRGASARAGRYMWRARTRISATASVVLGNTLSIYLSTAEGLTNTKNDGNLGTADAALATLERRRNLHYLGCIEIDLVSTTHDQIASGIIEIPMRYISVVWVNEFGNSLSATAGDHEFVLTPIPDEIQ